MKKKFACIIVSVVLLLSLTVSALALKTGTTEWDKPLFCETTKKVVVGGANGTQVKTLRNVTSRAKFDGKKSLHLSYTQSGSVTTSINASVEAAIKSVVSVSTSVSVSWTASEASSYSWDITKGDKKGYYNIAYKLKFNKHPYTYYTRTSTIFETKPWVQASSGTILNKGKNKPYFALNYSQN